MFSAHISSVDSKGFRYEITFLPTNILYKLNIFNSFEHIPSETSSLESITVYKVDHI